ncbi:unnamed protein product [Leptosia nina]|uniref:E3 ubiquitin-protein ligase n=1 Tax=Leptosia nina TaxID=320188 RepID=A0AAV1JC46_9NEOP
MHLRYTDYYVNINHHLSGFIYTLSRFDVVILITLYICDLLVHTFACSMEAPECPVCVQTMTVPIFQCQSGHSLCNRCTSKLRPPICPLCRQTMTQMRNWQLEELVSKSLVPCHNKQLGCIFNVKLEGLEDHLKECIFRELNCPLGKVFGTCSWSGKLKELLAHFKERHPQNSNINIASDIIIPNVSVFNDCRHFLLFQSNKQIFFLSFKIDTVQKVGLWLVQFMGTRTSAHQKIYEIHVTSQENIARKVTYIDHCVSDSTDANDVFRQGKCAVMPLNMMSHFISDSNIKFRCVIKCAGGEGNSHFVKNKQNRPMSNYPKMGPAPINRHKSPGPHVSRPMGPNTSNKNCNPSLKKGPRDLGKQRNNN